MIPVRNNRFIGFLCYDNDLQLLLYTIIVYLHCCAGGAIGIARVVRPLKLKVGGKGGSVAIAGTAKAQQSHEWRKRNDHRNYENIRCKIWNRIL